MNNKVVDSLSVLRTTLYKFQLSLQRMTSSLSLIIDITPCRRCLFTWHGSHSNITPTCQTLIFSKVHDVDQEVSPKVSSPHCSTSISTFAWVLRLQLHHFASTCCLTIISLGSSHSKHSFLSFIDPQIILPLSERFP